MEKVIITGNLGATPELRETKDGTPVTNLRVATNRSWTDKDGNRQQRTKWHDVVVFGKQARVVAKYLEKGSQVLIEGELSYSEIEGVDGYKHQTVQIKPAPGGVEFLGSRNKANETAPGFDDDEIPF
jgi:single-strand DNA-binding protein